MKFIKMQGTGNDFIIVDNRDDRYDITESQIIKMSNRKNIGCDQFIVLENSENADVFMRIYNSNGTEAKMCGNASRCVASLISEELDKEIIDIETISVIVNCKVLRNGEVCVDMGKPKLNWADIPLSHDANLSVLLRSDIPTNTPPVVVNMGNPHCVFFLDSDVDLDNMDIHTSGSYIEHHEIFPEGVNVEFVKVIARNNVNARVWERGAGETLACGTGACAILAAGVELDVLEPQTHIHFKGGDLLIEKDDNEHIIMTGAIEKTFTGEYHG